MFEEADAACCFQGQYHGNTEESSKLDSASQEQEKVQEKRGHTAKGRGGGSRYHFTLDYCEMEGPHVGLMGCPSSPVGVELLSQLNA